MNKGMIMLGLLLIVGLSFAILPGPWQYQWQNNTGWRYYCNWNEMGYGQYDAAYYYMQPYASQTELDNMYYYLGMMGVEVWGFYPDNGMINEFYATPFRTDMAGYNSANSLFKAVFNAAYREYYAATGDQGGVVRNYLAASTASYRLCASDSPWSPFFPEIR